MIFDKIENVGLYTGLGARLKRGMRLLKSGRLDKLPPGKHLIEGERLFASVQEYKGRPARKGRWEAHRRYIDIQYMVKGCELMGVSPVDRLRVEKKYNSKMDVMFLTGRLKKSSILNARERMFAIFYPTDAHMPMLKNSEYKGVVKKIVLKVLAR
jgi:YhcH/YjgK/YiaL family protein